VELFFEDLRAAWWALIPEPTLRHVAAVAVMFGFYYVIVAVAERLSGSRREAVYRSRGFAHDVAYYFYYKGGLSHVLIPGALITSLEGPLSFLKVQMLEGLPFGAKVVCWLLLSDFTGYWVHRARHHFRWLWAFHTTHHAQTDLNFATYTRTHPVEEFSGYFVGLFLALMLGLSPITGMFIWLALDFFGQTSHSRVAWTFGPLRWIFVTPRFHNFHHSLDPAHHDRNFGVLFSFWDRIFGTAVDETAPLPARYGLSEVQPTSFWSTLVSPFELLVKYYGPKPMLGPEPLPGTSPEPR